MVTVSYFWPFPTCSTFKVCSDSEAFEISEISSHVQRKDAFGQDQFVQSLLNIATCPEVGLNDVHHALIFTNFWSELSTLQQFQVAVELFLQPYRSPHSQLRQKKRLRGVGGPYSQKTQFNVAHGAGKSQWM